MRALTTTSPDTLLTFFDPTTSTRLDLNRETEHPVGLRWRPFGFAQSRNHYYVTNDEYLYTLDRKTLALTDTAKVLTPNSHECCYHRGIVYTASPWANGVHIYNTLTGETAFFDALAHRLRDNFTVAKRADDRRHINTVYVDDTCIKILYNWPTALATFDHNFNFMSQVPYPGQLNHHHPPMRTNGEPYFKTDLFVRGKSGKLIGVQQPKTKRVERAKGPSFLVTPRYWWELSGTGAIHVITRTTPPETIRLYSHPRVPCTDISDQKRIVLPFGTLERLDYTD